jgi:hypothetical protein
MIRLAARDVALTNNGPACEAGQPRCTFMIRSTSPNDITEVRTRLVRAAIAISLLASTLQ